jgi:hypothetical protein
MQSSFHFGVFWLAQMGEFEMDKEEEKELEQRRLTDEVRLAVESDLKRRYSWIGLVVAVIMSSVITLTVREILLPARVQMGVVEELQGRAMKQLGETSSQSEKLTTQFMELEQASEMLRQKLVEASQTNLEFTEDIRVKMTELSGVVSSLITQVNKLIANAKVPGIKTDGKLQPRVGKIEEDLEKSGENINKVKERNKVLLERYRHYQSLLSPHISDGQR